MLISLSAVGLAFRPEKVAEPILGRPLRDWLGTDPALSDASVGKRLTVGHEFRADPGIAAGMIVGGLVALPIALGLRGTKGILVAAALAVMGGLTGAMAQQFLGFRSQYLRATPADEWAFDRALAALGRGPIVDLDAAESAIAPLFDRIDVHARGNSYQDLRLSLLGWWLGGAIGRGDLARAADVADWVRTHICA